MAFNFLDFLRQNPQALMSFGASMMQDPYNAWRGAGRGMQGMAGTYGDWRGGQQQGAQAGATAGAQAGAGAQVGAGGMQFSQGPNGQMIPVPQTLSQFNSLKPGTLYKDPDSGAVRQKATNAATNISDFGRQAVDPLLNDRQRFQADAARPAVRNMRDY